VPEYELLEPEPAAEGGVAADRGLSALPEPSVGDLFFDIEGDPFAYWEGLDYLFGVWQPGDGLFDGAWRSFWALDRDEEKRAFKQVMDMFTECWAAHPEMHIYHYAPYEPTALKRLAGRHAKREEALDQLLRGRVFVDLYRVVRQGVRVGAERYSIKNLEPLYGFEREVKLRDANSSIVEFETVLEVGDPSGELRAQIEAYNRDDCVSTRRLRDWLEDRRLELLLSGTDVPRPAGGFAEPEIHHHAPDPVAVAVEAALTDGLPADPSARDGAQSQPQLAPAYHPERAGGPDRRVGRHRPGFSARAGKITGRDSGERFHSDCASSAQSQTGGADVHGGGGQPYRPV
jgi:hypothetical protein